MSALEGGVAAVSAATGQAAALLVILALARAGDNFVVSTHLFGGTYQQVSSQFELLYDIIR